MGALCRKNDIPYAIVKGKAVLGKLVHKKNATAVALTGVRAEDKSDLASLTNAFKSNFNERFSELRRRWGGHHGPQVPDGDEAPCRHPRQGAALNGNGTEKQRRRF